MEKIITLEEVKKHRRKSSVWIVIHNDVYDVTSFLEEHPGGEDSLMEVAGEDGTQGFEDVGHSDDARELLKKYKVGSLPPQPKSTFIKSCKVKRKASSRRSSQCSVCSATSCQNTPDMDKSEKTWRTFDGSDPSDPRERKYEQPSGPSRAPASPQPRVRSVLVPRERRPRGPPCGRHKKRPKPRPPPPPPPSSNLKWAVLALAGAIVLGFVIKKTLTK